MATSKSMEVSQSSEDKLNIVRETFSIHIILAYLSGQSHFNKQNLNLIARDNLTEVVTKAN